MLQDMCQKNSANISTISILELPRNIFQGTLMKKCPYSKIKMITLRHRADWAWSLQKVILIYIYVENKRVSMHTWPFTQSTLLHGLSIVLSTDNCLCLFVCEGEREIECEYVCESENCIGGVCQIRKSFIERNWIVEQFITCVSFIPTLMNIF